jgi:hypothetical protein
MADKFKTLFVYQYNDKLILAPGKRYLSGVTVPQSRFAVVDLNLPTEEMWNLIIENLDFFEQLETEYDKNAEDHKNFNQNLRKAAKARSYREFLENSAFGQIMQKDEKVYLAVFNRAKTFKGYQGYYLEPEEYGLHDQSVVNRLREVFLEYILKKN